MNKSQTLQQVAKIIAMTYITETPVFVKILNVLILSYFCESLLLLPIPIILSIECLLHSIKLLVKQASNISFELRKFTRIWIDNELFNELIKEEKSLKSTLASHYFKDYSYSFVHDRGGETSPLNVPKLINHFEIKELRKSRLGTWFLNGEELKVSQIKARLNGCKGKLNPNIENDSLNKKIDFYTEVLRQIDENESIEKEGLILT